MTTSFDRRQFLKTAAAVGPFAACASWNAGCLLAADVDSDSKVRSSTPHGDKLGWRLANTAYTFNSLPFYEAALKTAALGVRLIEGFSWQPLSKDKPQLQMNETLPANGRKEVKRWLADHGMTLVSCYLRELPNEESVARKKFEFGKELGLEFFVAEPPPESMDLMEKLCDEYRLSLSIHNHPKPMSKYWNPASIVKVTKGRSKRLGACCDTGHWARSGIKPVEALKLLEGRIVSLHLKDVAEFGKVDAEEVPWGTGKGDIAAILAEIRRQGIKPVIAIEYERQGDTVADLRRSIAFYERLAIGR
jgi:sugar phosphate isomerase/epimerase